MAKKRSKFRSKASYRAWKLFELTGDISVHNLFFTIDNKEQLKKQDLERV